MQNLSYENEFDFHENELVGGTNFHYEIHFIMTRFAREAKTNSLMA